MYFTLASAILGWQAKVDGEDNIETRRGRKTKEGTRSKERAGAIRKDQVIMKGRREGN